MLDDVLEPGLSVVYCGTAAGTRSAAVRQYYAGRGNKFWPILHEVVLTPRLLAPSEYLLLPKYGDSGGPVPMSPERPALGL